MKEVNMLTWLSEWYKSNCDGDWEHDYGVIIATIDNPGWSITIDLENTDAKVEEIAWRMHENGEEDWFGYKVENGKYEASGDPSKLDFLLKKFRSIIEKTQV